MTKIWLKTLCFAVVVPGTVAGWIPYWFISTHRELYQAELGPLRWLGLPVFLAGAALAGWCALNFVIHGHGTPAPIDPPKKLVVQGPYRYVRNPMYWGIILILLGESVYFGSGTLLVYALLLLTGFHLFTVLYEEPALRKTFGKAYIEYCGRVNRWWPGGFIKR